MNVREKLVQLLKDIMPLFTFEEQVDHLIAHGVTVHEWISVDDRLPEPFVPVLVQMPGEEPFPTVREGFISNDRM